MKLVPWGPGATLVELAAASPGRTTAVVNALAAAFPTAVLTPGPSCVLVEAADTSGLAAATTAILARPDKDFPATLHTIPVVYDGPDLEEVARALSTTAAGVVALHASDAWPVAFTGFLPGFGYLGDVPKTLQLPRRAQPRVRVDAFSVALAGPYTGIYPLPSPGGWNLIGRAVDTWLLDPSRSPPVRLQAGDKVRFTAVEQGDIWTAPAPAVVATAQPSLLVEQPGILTSVQDGGRFQARRWGFPPSGPLDAETFMAANLAVGNAAQEASLEVPLGGLVLRALRPFLASINGAVPVRYAVGDLLHVPPNQRGVHYVSFQGGLDVPEVLGSRSSLVAASLGGFHGRPLKRADTLGISNRIHSQHARSRVPGTPSGAVTLGIHAGPQAHLLEAALQVLVRSSFRIAATSNRVGTRLDGPLLPRAGVDQGPSLPMRRGAIQVTTQGTPVVLGPDHPVTGGYPVVAWLDGPGQALLGRLLPGQQLRFRLV